MSSVVWFVSGGLFVICMWALLDALLISPPRFRLTIPIECTFDKERLLYIAKWFDEKGETEIDAQTLDELESKLGRALRRHFDSLEEKIG